MMFTAEPKTQEVEVKLTLEVDINVSKEEIENHFKNVILFDIMEINIKEEAEIYKTNE